MDDFDEGDVPMQDGVYRIRITAGSFATNGVIVLRGRCIEGGTASSVYQGTLAKDGSRLTIELTVVDFDPETAPPQSPLPTSPPSVLTMTGTVDADGFHLVGRGRFSAVVELSGRLAAPSTPLA